MTLEKNIELLAQYLKKYAPKYNILVYSPIIAQCILESGKFESELAKNANNYFGLKYKVGRCPSALKTPYYKIGSEQSQDGTYISSKMQWFQFKDMEQCVVGYLDFINISRYSNLKGIKNPKTYLENIKSDGYATSINYVQNLMNVIKTYNLTKYDTNINQGGNNMGYKVAIDAGHGSNTAGKRTPDGWREHWTNVKCANYFDNVMKRCGVDTIKIAWNDTNSKNDTDAALSTRQSQIKNAKCDISVSWHANAFGDGKTYNSGQGIETLIHNNSAKVKDSKTLAVKVQNYLIKGTQQKNRGVKSANLAMCNCVAMGTKASILIEIGFMTNEYEAKLIQSDAFCLECAEEAAQGVCEYLGIAYVKPNGQIGSTPVQTTPIKPVSTASTYTVVKGDTLSKIGQKTGIAWKTIADLNGLKSPYTIKVGQVLKLTNSINSTTSPSISTPTVSAKKYVHNGIDYSLVFDPTYYANKYTDLKKVYGTNTTTLFDHFVKYGMKEKRQASATFNVEVYKNNYVDLQKAFGDNYPEYYKHYCQFGKKEGRKAI